MQYYGRVRLVSTVKAGAFWPRPEVDSAVVRIDVEERQLDNRPPTADGRPLPDDESAQRTPTDDSPSSTVGGRRSAVEAEAAFFRVVRAGFSEKRKQLKNNLRQLGLSDEAIAAALERAGIDGRRRAETLTVEEWEELSQIMTMNGTR